jgi:serine/threonine-protein kinase RsbT
MKRSEPRPGEHVISISSDIDIVTARTAARSMAEALGFTGAEQVSIAAAVSEVARNIVEYARPGEIVLARVDRGPMCGLEVIARDEGPGITDIPLAMKEGYSSARGLGLGLPGTQKLMDDFSVESEIGRGTTIRMRKWLRGKKAVLR